MQIEGRAADDLEHVGGGGLLLQRLAQFSRALLHVVEQPHVLDRDHGLIGKRFSECDLLVGERLHDATLQEQNSDGRSFALQRYAEHSAYVRRQGSVCYVGVRIELPVDDVNGFTLMRNTADNRRPPRLERFPLHAFLVFWQKAVACGVMILIVLQKTDRRPVCTAQASRRFCKRIEHDLQIERGAADDLEHLGGGGLLLQRFAQIVGALAQLVEQAGILDGDDGLVGKGAHQGDLLLGEGPHLPAPHADDADEVFLPQEGTASTVRARSYWRTIGEKPGSAVMSATWTVRRSSAANLAGPARPGWSGIVMCSANSGEALWCAAPTRTAPSYCQSAARLPSHRRVALARMVLNTGPRSVGELLMTPRTSDSAVCCSSDSLKSSVRWRSSLSRRVFSMAMTACAAKLCTSSICLSVNDRTSWRYTLITPINLSSLSIGTETTVRYPPRSAPATANGSR